MWPTATHRQNVVERRHHRKHQLNNSCVLLGLNQPSWAERADGRVGQESLCCRSALLLVSSPAGSMLAAQRILAARPDALLRKGCCCIMVSPKGDVGSCNSRTGCGCTGALGAALPGALTWVPVRICNAISCMQPDRIGTRGTASGAWAQS